MLIVLISSLWSQAKIAPEMVRDVYARSQRFLVVHLGYKPISIRILSEVKCLLVKNSMNLLPGKVLKKK